MESICQFSPLWRRPELVSKPQKAVEKIRLQSLKLFLSKHRSQVVTSLDLNEILLECNSIFRQLLRDATHENEILQRIVDIGVILRTSAVDIVEASLTMWYASSVPVFTRDPQDGLPLDSGIGDTGNVASTLAWNRSYSNEQHAIGNLGLMAMLMTAENWLPPKHPNLKAASIVSNAVTTILFASYLICPQILRNSETFNTPMGQTNEALALFIKASWQVARENFDKFDSPPGSEFGATPDEVKLSHNGKRFLTKIGRNTWSEPAYWHPCRKVPGSNWNKYIRNWSRPIFPTTSPQRNELVVHLPSTLFGLAQPWAVYYNVLRTRFHLTGRPRRELCLRARQAQYGKTSAATGRPYSSRKISPRFANGKVKLEQEYLRTIPSMKEPMTDSHGHLTLPFMTAALRALRFQEEPNELVRYFKLISFW